MLVGITEADARLARFGILGLLPGRVRFPREMPESVIVIAMVLTGPNNSLCALFLGRSTCVLKPALLVVFRYPSPHSTARNNICQKITQCT